MDGTRLTLNDSAIEEIVALARGADRLPEILALASQAQGVIGTLAIAKRIAPRVGIPVLELRRILVSLLNIYHTQKRLKVTHVEIGEEISGALVRGLAKQDGQSQLETWNRAKDKVVEAVRQLYADHPFELAFKAYRVATARQYELTGMKLFTDARPVFNEAGDAIAQMVVTHVFSLDYHDGDSHRVLQFNLDANDIKELRDLCDRAERKAGVIKRDLKVNLWPTTIFRENIDQEESDN